MLLSEILRSQTDALSCMQRYVNNGSRSGYISRFPAPYDPFCSEPRFSLPYFDIPLQDPNLFITGRAPRSRIGSFAFPEQHFRICLHPLMWAQYGDALRTRAAGTTDGGIPHIAVCPTSSVRTVRTLGPADVLIKLQYDGVVGRVRRGISRAAAQYTSDISAVVHEIIHNNGPSVPSFAFLDEPVAAHYRLSGTSGVSVIYREATPIPDSSGRSALIPGHSLWSADRHNAGHPAILEQVIREIGGPPLDALERLVLRPLLSAYVELATQWGIAPEAHGQNTYLEISGDLTGSRIVFQGFDSFLYDAEVRTLRGLSVRPPSPHHKYLNPADDQRFIERSWYFDEKLSRYFIEPVAECFAGRFGFEPAVVYELVTSICGGLLAAIPFPYLPDVAYCQVDTGCDKPREMTRFNPRFRKVVSSAVSR